MPLGLGRAQWIAPAHRKIAMVSLAYRDLLTAERVREGWDVAKEVNRFGYACAL